MNSNSPLLPQGTLADQKNKGRARVKIAVFFVLAVHGIGLLALLMQGCRRDDSSLGTGEPTNNVASDLRFDPGVQPSNDMATATGPAPTNLDLTPPPSASTGAPPSFTPTPEPSTPTPTPTPPAPGPAATTDYKVLKGENFTTIARKFKITVAALQDANPGVDSSKLQVNQVLHIPASTAAASVPAPSAGTQLTHKVKSNETLDGISRRYGTTVKAIRSLNGLKTDRITVGQTLKIPVKTPAVTPTFDGGAGTTAPTNPGTRTQ